MTERMSLRPGLLLLTLNLALIIHYLSRYIYIYFFFQFHIPLICFRLPPKMFSRIPGLKTTVLRERLFCLWWWWFDEWNRPSWRRQWRLLIIFEGYSVHIWAEALRIPTGVLRSFPQCCLANIRWQHCRPPPSCIGLCSRNCRQPRYRNE
jgi:hypothetical protein